MKKSTDTGKVKATENPESKLDRSLKKAKSAGKVGKKHVSPPKMASKSAKKSMPAPAGKPAQKRTPSFGFLVDNPFAKKKGQLKTLIATPSKFNIAAVSKRSKVITKPKSAAKKTVEKAKKSKMSTKDQKKAMKKVVAAKIAVHRAEKALKKKGKSKK